MKMPRIRKVTAGNKPNHIAITWMGGPVVSLDLSESIKRVRGLRVLNDPAVFRRVRVGEGGHSIAWTGQEVDVGADTLWRLTLLEQGREYAVEFNDWRMKYGLSLSAGADALGISRRMMAYYSSGEKSVPKTVLLACKGWQIGHKQAA